MAPGRTVITGTSALTFGLDGERAAEDGVDGGAALLDVDDVGEHAEPIRAASRPAISFPSAVAGNKTAAGPAD